MQLFLNKKLRYLSLAIFLSVYCFSTFYLLNTLYYPFYTGLFFILVGVLSYFVQFPNYSRGNVFFIVSMPILLSVGLILCLVYFPNLGLPLRGLFFAGSIVLYYLMYLTNNILLVVEDKDYTIPLYRVAVAWSQILLVITAIPVYAGTFKTPFNSILQSLFLSMFTFIFTLYYLWLLNFDEDVKEIKIKEGSVVSIIVSYIIFMSSLSVSFFATEPFLRALYISAVLMACTGYLQTHYKNIVTKKIILEYLVICLIFLILLFVFKP